MLSSANRLSDETLIKEQLRDILSTEDLDHLTSKMVRSASRYQEEVKESQITTRVKYNLIKLIYVLHVYLFCLNAVFLHSCWL